MFIKWMHISRTVPWVHLWMLVNVLYKMYFSTKSSILRQTIGAKLPIRDSQFSGSDQLWYFSVIPCPFQISSSLYSLYNSVHVSRRFVLDWNPSFNQIFSFIRSGRSRYPNFIFNPLQFFKWFIHYIVTLCTLHTTQTYNSKVLLISFEWRLYFL